jgi:hypothetical protein
MYMGGEGERRGELQKNKIHGKICLTKIAPKFGRILHTCRLCSLEMATRRTEGELQVLMIGLGKIRHYLP